MKTYQTPHNLVELLNGVIKSALYAPFYASKINEPGSIESLDEFAKLPVVPVAEYRKQRLIDVLSDPTKAQWIVGAYRGQDPSSVAVAEGAEESVNRFDLFADALKEQLVEAKKNRSCAIVTSPERRYFAAEVGAILIHAGIPSHVFVDYGTERIYEQLFLTKPDVVVILSDDLQEDALPPGIELCVTFRQSQKLKNLPQLDIYHVDELGFLGQSTDCETYILNRDMYFYEVSHAGNLVVTSLYNRVQPVLRVETLDRVKRLNDESLEFVALT